MTTSEAAARLNTTKANVLRLINAKNPARRLPARRCSDCGTEWLIDENDLNRFAALERKAGRPRKEQAKWDT